MHLIRHSLNINYSRVYVMWACERKYRINFHANEDVYAHPKIYTSYALHIHVSSSHKCDKCEQK